MRKENSKQLLVVDDDIICVNMAKMYFEAKGHHVDFAISSSQAIRMLPHSNYKLIILDYNMPILNGIEFLEILSKNNFTKKVNIVMLTGEANDELIVKAKNLGAKAVFNKEDEINEIYKQISLYLC